MDILRYGIVVICARGFDSMVMEMQPVEIPEFPKLRGEEAIKALHDFMREFEEQRDKELTDKQISALIKLALGLISSIEAEERSNRTMNKLWEEMKEKTRFVTRFRKQLQNTFLNGLPF